MMTKIFYFSLVCFLLIWVNPVFSQTSTRSEKDPKAKASLDLMKRRYESFSSFEISFTLEMELPEQARQIQKGLFIRKGVKYKFASDQQTVLCDGKSLWVILPKEKEVQINDMPEMSEKEDILSPDALFNIYKRKDLSFFVLKEYEEKGKILQLIGFKPIDKMADYSKMELVLDKKSGEIISFKAFAKDGSRYLFRFGVPKTNQSIPESLFQFKKSDFPTFYIEDLRS